jgi:hypothetical protein
MSPYPMSSARMITTLGGPGGGVGDGTTATGVGGAVGELPPQEAVRLARAAVARRCAVRRDLMDLKPRS